MDVWGWYGAAVMRLIGASFSFCDEGAGNSIGHGASSIDHGVRSKLVETTGEPPKAACLDDRETDRRDLDRNCTTARRPYGARLRSEWRMMKEPRMSDQGWRTTLTKPRESSRQDGRRPG